MIVPNIIAYGLMAIGAMYAMDFSIKQGNKFTKIINFVIMFWNLFMFLYLIKDYDNIVNSPINARLNYFETITNLLLAFWLLSFKFKRYGKTNK
jgi:hypothetical protein